MVADVDQAGHADQFPGIQRGASGDQRHQRQPVLENFQGVTAVRVQRRRRRGGCDLAEGAVNVTEQPETPAVQ